MTDSEIIADAEKREAALGQLHDAVVACSSADLTRDEILHVVRRLFADDDVLIQGPLFDDLEDGQASEILRIIYGGMAEGATLAFGVDRRTRAKIHELCANADIGRGNVTMVSGGTSLRVSITKLQS